MITIGNANAEMVLIPSGNFQMGDAFGDGTSDEKPVHSVYLSMFYIDRCEVSKSLWDDVYGWAVSHGYTFDNVGSGKASNHPVHTIHWYDAVKWCNARSEKESLTPCYYTNGMRTNVYRAGNLNVTNDCVKWNANGYRLPTEAEWEKAARGGASGHRFPWSNVDTITHSQANYLGSTNYLYDISPTLGYHPSYATGSEPYTSPVGSFSANGYGLYDMAGNLWEWCWDWHGSTWYTNAAATQSDTHGPSTGITRELRGGHWSSHAFVCRLADRHGALPNFCNSTVGFRCAQRFVGAAGDDTDGDGWTNEQEDAAGTDPQNSASALRIVDVTSVGGDVCVTWSTVGGRTYVLEAAPSVSGVYTNLSPEIVVTTGGESTTNWVDFGATTNAPGRFYRVRLVP